MTEPLTFAERRRLLAEKRGRTPTGEFLSEKKVEHKFDDDLIPDVLGERTEDDMQIDAIIESLDVLACYRKWIGKEVDEKTTSLKEGIKVSCPQPHHRDSHPSAWLNADNRRWFCGGCQEGGDIYDLAAIHFGYDRPGYKDGKNFHELRKDMAESFGYRFKKVAGAEVIWREEEPVPALVQEDPVGTADHTPAPAPAAGSDVSDDSTESTGSQAPAGANSVTVLHERDVEDDVQEIEYPRLNWHAIVSEDTFLYEYLNATTNDDSPEEYHFWHGLIALGHAVGRNVYLNDTRPVYGNLLVCLLGGTGFGKSRSRAWLDEVVEEALPFNDNGLDTSGCKLVPVPASGENLINQFQHIAWDPSLPKGSPEVRTPVNGIVDYDEFAGLLARANRQGATLKQIIMGFSDARNKINSSSNTGGTYEAVRPFCSITASTQPKAVRAILSKTDTGSGFLNRWLFIGGPRKKREVMGGVHTSIRVDLSKAVDRLKKVRGWGATERDIRFTEDGLDEFEDFMQKRVFPIQIKDETDLLTRLDLTMKRLILLFCINEHKVEADAQMVRTVEPLLEYLIKCYGILSAEIGISAMSEITTEILRHIKRIEELTGRGASARELGQRLQRKNYSPDMIKRALETMVALDWIDVDKSKGPGRPTIRYKAVS